jgi:small subunit ribosomal protein S21
MGPTEHPRGPVPPGESNTDELFVKTVAAKGVLSSVAEVKVQEGESIESALRRFKRKVQQEDIIKDIKKHSFYLKPGDRRRAKQALARKRTRKKQRREVE